MFVCCEGGCFFFPEIGPQFLPKHVCTSMYLTRRRAAHVSRCSAKSSSGTPLFFSLIGPSDVQRGRVSNLRKICFADVSQSAITCFEIGRGGEEGGPGGGFPPAGRSPVGPSSVGPSRFVPGPSIFTWPISQRDSTISWSGWGGAGGRGGRCPSPPARGKKREKTGGGAVDPIESGAEVCNWVSCHGCVSPRHIQAHPRDHTWGGGGRSARTAVYLFM